MKFPNIRWFADNVVNPLESRLDATEPNFVELNPLDHRTFVSVAPEVRQKAETTLYDVLTAAQVRGNQS